MEKMFQIKSNWNCQPGGELVADFHPAHILYNNIDDEKNRFLNSKTSWVTQQVQI
jgi:hypothetical protein